MTEQVSAEVLFGRRVQVAREAAGWTQERVRRELRGLCGIELSSTQWSRLENGERPIRVNEAVALCRVLGVSLTDEVIVTAEEYAAATAELAMVEAERSRFAQKVLEAQADFDRCTHRRSNLRLWISEYERRHADGATA